MSYNDRYSGHNGDPYSGQFNSNTAAGGYNSTSTPNGPIERNQNTAALHSPPSSILSIPEFLSNVEAAKADIRTLSSYISYVAAAHQRTLSSYDGSASAALDSIITQTRVLNMSIKNQIRFLEVDAAYSETGRHTLKIAQVSQLKTSFKKQLRDYRDAEAKYERRYREQIARQYRIVSPDATESEVHEATNANWGNGGVFEAALKTNRTAAATTVLGAVRARHNDIQQIERTLTELNQLFEDLAEAVVIQEPKLEEIELNTEIVKHNVEAGNVQLDKGILSVRRARKMKWICFWITLTVLLVLAIILAILLHPGGPLNKR